MCRISPGISELTKKLMAQNIDVYLISGGFRQMINCARGIFLSILLLLLSPSIDQLTADDRFRWYRPVTGDLHTDQLAD
ncbi:hypothetical protein GW17_00015095, partial [Ensete ventricosum]